MITSTGSIPTHNEPASLVPHFHRPLEGTEAASASRDGAFIRLAVLQSGGLADVSFRVADEGGFMKLNG